MPKLSKLKQPVWLAMGSLTFPEIAFAKAGLAELEGPAAVVVPLFFVLASFTVPLSLAGSWSFSWPFRLLQIPLIFIILFLTAWRLHKAKVKKFLYVLILPPLYGVLIFSTNIAGTSYFQADHSDYFPKEKKMNDLLQRGGQQEKPLEREIRQNLGEPAATGTFSASSPALPKEMEEMMKSSNLEKAYFLAYIERCRGPKAMEERTYYILLDPLAHRYVTMSAYYDQQAVAEKWPHRHREIEETLH